MGSPRPMPPMMNDHITTGSRCIIVRNQLIVPRCCCCHCRSAVGGGGGPSLPLLLLAAAPGGAADDAAPASASTPASARRCWLGSGEGGCRAARPLAAGVLGGWGRRMLASGVRRAACKPPFRPAGNAALPVSMGAGGAPLEAPDQLNRCQRHCWSRWRWGQQPRVPTDCHCLPAASSPA